MDGLPTLGHDTLRGRAANAGRIWEAQQRARDRVVDEFDTVDDPRDVGVERRGGGFAPARGFLERAEPREAAHQLDSEFPRQDLGPADVQRGDDGFVPTEDTRRRSAAMDLEEETPLDTVDPFGDLRQTDDGGFGLAEEPRREVAAAELDPEFPRVDVGRDDVQREGDAFGLTPDAEREVGAARLEEETPLDDVGTDDVRRTDDGFELREDVIDENRGLFF